MFKGHRNSRRLLWLILVFAMLHPLALTKEHAQSAPPGRFVDGELLIKYSNNSGPGLSRERFRQMGASVVEDFGAIGWQRIRLPEGLTVEQAIKEYGSVDGVESVQPNYVYKVAVTPDDSLYDSLYGMAKIQAPSAWNTTSGSASIVVAVIDTGIRYTHEDLAANMWRNPGEVAGNGVDDDGNGFVDDLYGYDFINNDSDPNDDFGHGTHVAGTIGAVGNNSRGVTGVNWAVRLMAVKTHNASGDSTSAAVISAFQYVAMMKLRGVNIRATSNSWSGPPEAPGYDQALKDAIDAAGNAGILNVFAAGNSSSDIDSSPAYPGSYDSPSIIAVASSKSDDERSGFSNYGPVAVDLAAPGSAVLSTYSSNDTSYQTFSGTSMAAPHVAGAAALLAASNPSLSVASLKATLLNTVDVLPQWAGLVLTGGRLNVANAIQNPTFCNYSIPSSSAFFQPEGGNGQINIASSTNCGWMVTGKPAWVGITSKDTGSGDGTVNFTVAANPTGVSRQAEMSIAGHSFMVVQDGGATADCELVAIRNFKTLPGAGGSGSITILTGSRCGWIATTSASWLSISSAGAGTGTGSITVSAGLNPGSRRKATVTINGVSITFKQKGT